MLLGLDEANAGKDHLTLIKLAVDYRKFLV